MAYKVSAAKLSEEVLNESDYVRSVLQNVSNIRAGVMNALQTEQRRPRPQAAPAPQDLPPAEDADVVEE